MNPLDDRTAEERLRQNKDIIAFLHNVTISSHTPSREMQARSVARVRSRLLEEGQLNMEDITQSAIQPIGYRETNQEKVPSSMALLRKRPVWQQRLGLLVAVLCISLIVGSFVAVEQLVHHKSTTTGASSHNGSHLKGGQFVYFPIVEVHINLATFKQSPVVIHKGMGIELISDVHVQHIIRNGYWKKSAPVPLKERGIPKVDFAVVDRQLIGPFNMVGTYHLYDAIHGGMNLVVIVQK